MCGILKLIVILTVTTALTFGSNSQESSDINTSNDSLEQDVVELEDDTDIAHLFADNSNELAVNGDKLEDNLNDSKFVETDSKAIDFEIEGVPKHSDESSSSIESLPSICQQKGSIIPHEENCNQFYYCENNKAEIGTCPPSALGPMWFDPNNKDALCNYPEEICEFDNSVCDCSSLYPPAVPDPLIEDDITCPVDNRLHLYPSSKDCARYFVCLNRKVFRMECQTGFQYNAEQEVCDSPEQANCHISDAECPTKSVTFLPHPDNCESFLFCINGLKTVQTCPFYYIWDIDSKSCKRRNEAECILDENTNKRIF